MATAYNEAKMAIACMLKPSAIPMAAPYQILAAVVKFWILSFFSDFKMIPAPKKPTPDTICAAIRVGSPLLWFVRRRKTS